MKKLVQKVFDISPIVSSDPVRLQDFIDEKSSENWEYSGQIGLFYIFKRWEEIPNVINGGSESFRDSFSEPPYRPSYGQYNPSYQQYNQYSPQYQTYNRVGSPSPHQYDPEKFGTIVRESDDIHSNIFNTKDKI